MRPISVTGLSYQYPQASRLALDGIDLDAAEGECLWLRGASGSGKSSLLCCLNGLIPQSLGGERTGRVSVAGSDPGGEPLALVARRVGMVFQNPGAQLFRERVAADIAFGPQNLGWSAAAAAERASRAMEQLGLTALANRRVAHLSGGERQRVALAGVLAMGARVLLLDEPGSDLDAVGRRLLAAALTTLQEAGHTLVVSSHEPDGVLPQQTRAVDLQAGRLRSAAPPQEVLPAREPRPAGEVVGRLRQADVGRSAAVLRGVDLEVCRGQLTALTGANGSGKSTLLWTLAGLIRPLAGEVWMLGERRPTARRLARRVGLLLQNPDEQLFADSVEAELAWAGGDARYWRSRIGLDHRAGAHPSSLSRGERQRLALGAVLAGQPQVLLLDEPTSGLDQEHWATLLRLVTDHADETGAAVLFATHHAAAVRAFADRVIHLER